MIGGHDPQPAASRGREALAGPVHERAEQARPGGIDPVQARAVGIGVVAAFLLGSCAAAAGILLEGDGYAVLGPAGGTLIFAVSAWPLWLLLRAPARTR